MSNEQLFLRVPGAWLEVCGLGTIDRVFPILSIEVMEFAGRNVTYVTVNRDGRHWIIDKQARRAEYVHKED